MLRHAVRVGPVVRLNYDIVTKGRANPKALKMQDVNDLQYE